MCSRGVLLQSLVMVMLLVLPQRKIVVPLCPRRKPLWLPLGTNGTLRRSLFLILV